MKSYLLMLSAVGLVAVGGAARAAGSEVSDYLQRLNVAATTKVAAAGVNVDQGLKLKTHVDSDGRLTGVHVVGSSGSLEADQKATEALRRFRGPLPPVGLGGAEVTLNIVQGPMTQAKVP